MITDEELTALALSADPNLPLDADATPFVDPDGAFEGPLPAWYMPRAVVRTTKRWYTPVALLIISAMTLITGLGLCITYGHLVVA